MNETYAKECEIECIENGNTLNAEVDRFQKEKYLSVYMNTVKINLQYNTRNNSYIGKMAGLEFISKGPKLLGHHR
jgi:hypothetical protein